MNIQNIQHSTKCIITLLKRLDFRFVIEIYLISMSKSYQLHIQFYNPFRRRGSFFTLNILASADGLLTTAGLSFLPGCGFTSVLMGVKPCVRILGTESEQRIKSSQCSLYRWYFIFLKGCCRYKPYILQHGLTPFFAETRSK